MNYNRLYCLTYKSSSWIGNKLINLEWFSNVRQIHFNSLCHSNVANSAKNQSTIHKSRAGIVFEKPPKSENDVETDKQKQSRIKDKVKSNDCNKKQVIKDDANTFGTLAEQISGKKIHLDSEKLPDDPDNFEVMAGPIDKHPRKYYLYTMQNLIYKDKFVGIRKAFELFEQAKQERKMIDRPYYAMMMKACSIIGDVDKAIELIRECQKNNIPIFGSMITTLFTSFSKSEQDPKLLLSKLNEIKDEIFLQKVFINPKNYNSLIAAYVRLGEYETGLKLVEEMKKKEMSINIDTLNMLMIGCSERKEDGALKALKLFSSILNSKIKPDVHTLVWLMKSIKQCGIGNKQELLTFLNHLNQYSNNQLLIEESKKIDEKLKLNEKDSQKQLNLNNQIKLTNKNDSLSVNQMKLQSNDNHMMISDGVSTSNLPSVVDLDLKTFDLASNRFKLLGGLPNLIHIMKQHQIRPTTKIVTQIIPLLPNDSELSDKILQLMDQFNLKPDAGLFNNLIKCAATRKDFLGARKLLDTMNSKHIPANLITFGIMAILCQQSRYSKKLIKDMDNFNLKPNVVIFGQLIKTACKNNDIKHVMWLINQMKKEQVLPDRRLVEILVCFIQNLSDKLTEKEKLKTSTSQDVKQYFEFTKFIKNWLRSSIMDANTDFINQFNVPKAPRNYDLHKFNVIMTKLIEKKTDMINKPNQE